MSQDVARLLQVLDLELILVKISLSLVELVDLFFLAKFFLSNVLLQFFYLVLPVRKILFSLFVLHLVIFFLICCMLRQFLFLPQIRLLVLH